MALHCQGSLRLRLKLPVALALTLTLELAVTTQWHWQSTSSSDILPPAGPGAAAPGPQPEAQAGLGYSAVWRRRRHGFCATSSTSPCSHAYVIVLLYRFQCATGNLKGHSLPVASNISSHTSLALRVHWQTLAISELLPVEFKHRLTQTRGVEQLLKLEFKYTVQQLEHILQSRKFRRDWVLYCCSMSRVLHQHERAIASDGHR